MQPVDHQGGERHHEAHALAVGTGAGNHAGATAARRHPPHRIALAAGAVAIGALAVYGAMQALAPAPARVLVTGEDCLRAFDDATCHGLVDRALALHNRTAPSFAEQATCVFMMGPAACKPVNENGIEIGRYGPPMVAILVGRSLDDLLPLYAGAEKRPAGAPAADGPGSAGQPVYFHGTRVGTLAMIKFGGADLWTVTDARGRPVTAASVARLRAR